MHAEFERIVGNYVDLRDARVLGEFRLAPRQFAMVGNSLRSDIEPVLALGGWGVYMPYHVTWAHERDSGVDEFDNRLVRVETSVQIHGALRELAVRASDGVRG